MVRIPADGLPRCTECGSIEGTGHFDNCIHAKAQPRDPLLVEREKTHGSFMAVSHCAQEIKQAIGKWDTQGINKNQREALDLIATKIGRILAGNPKEKDHWKDISGYALLGMEACD